MTNGNAAREFLESAAQALDAFDYVAIGPAGRPLDMVEITRGESPALEVRVPGRPRVVPPLSEEVQGALAERGFASADGEDPTEPWSKAAGSAGEAVDVALSLFHDVLHGKPDPRLDVRHGNHRARYEAKRRLSDLRERIERVLEEEFGGPPAQDDEGDFLLPIADVQVVISPRILPQGPAVVRVFAVTNVQVNLAPELGLVLARMNFNLLFGRFALDADRKTIVFDEALLGEPLNEEALRFSIGVVADTADEWDDKLKQMFGGLTYQEVLKQQGRLAVPPAKPGSGDEHRPGLYL